MSKSAEQVIVADIGGTNARFATVTANSVTLENVGVYPCADYQNFDQAYLAYCESNNISQPLKACISLACPVAQDQIVMTNNHWSFSKREMQHRLGLSQMMVLNDFTAMAYGMLFLSEDERITVQESQASYSDAPRAVIGPGTGLGVSGLIPVAGDSGKWHALSTEGGHISFAPQDQLEMEILTRLNQSYGRVSVERLLCGEGLLTLYRTMGQLWGSEIKYDSAAKISAAALSGNDLIAEQVLNKFCQILGAVVGDVVLAQGARGGVYLAGGILPRISEFLLNSGFCEAMCNKGRMSDYLKQVPVWLAIAEYPGLLGAAAAIKLT